MVADDESRSLSGYVETGETCEISSGALSAPIFVFRDTIALVAPVSTMPAATGAGSFALTCRSAKLDPLTLPVRGDLAHVRLAGKVFVPHYAVPMPHLAAAGGATLRKAPQAEADVLAQLAAGSSFDVLDMAGSYAWGELLGTDGGPSSVGYIALAELTAQP